MKRKQLNIRLPQSHINRLEEFRKDDGLSQSEIIMRLIDEEWSRRQEKNKMSNTAPTKEIEFVLSPDSGRWVYQNNQVMVTIHIDSAAKSRRGDFVVSAYDLENIEGDQLYSVQRAHTIEKAMTNGSEYFK